MKDIRIPLALWVLFEILSWTASLRRLDAVEERRGILYGPFTFYPRLHLCEGYESNVFRTPVSNYPDFYTRYQPVLLLEIGGPRLQLHLEGLYDRYLYSGVEDPLTRKQNRRTIFGEARGTMVLPTNLQFELRGAYKDTLDPLYGEYTLDRSLLRRFRVELEAGIIQPLFYEAVKSELRYRMYRDLFPVTIAAANRTIHGVETRQALRPVPTAEYFLELGYQRIVKENARGTPFTQSPVGDFVRLFLGFTGSFNPLYRLVARAGGGTIQYKDEPLLWVPELSLEFFYIPNAFVELGILGRSFFQDSVYTNYLRVLQGGITWKQRLGRVFTFTQGILAWNTRYSDPTPREDQILLFRSSLQWEPLGLQEVRANLGYEGSRRNSDDVRAEFINHTAFLDLTLSF